MIQLALVTLVSLVLHEFAHGVAAEDVGDRTPRLHGRLTLNPFAHVDPLFTLAMPLLSYALSGVIVGAAKPIPIDYGPMTPPQQLRVASAGMLVNCALALGGWLGGWPVLWQVNVALVVFNLLPIPPLDGWRLFQAVRHA